MKSNQLPRLTIVVPCYNEEPVLPNSAPILQKLLQHLISKSPPTVNFYLWTMVAKTRPGHSSPSSTTKIQSSPDYSSAAIMVRRQR